MALSRTARRRLLGGILLSGALVMLIAGQTVLHGRLSLGALGIYWLVCLLLTCGSILVAFADVRALYSRTRREQRDLFETTLKEIESSARTRANGKRGKSKPAA